MITVEELIKNEEIQCLLDEGENQLEKMGYTEHGSRHRAVVCERIERILTAFGATNREIQLGLIAGYLHDIGCAVNREDHSQSGGILAYMLLTRLGMDYCEAAKILNAIGNHDEGSGIATDAISAALILADKSDVHRSRVRGAKLDENKIYRGNDIHDRVNYAVEDSSLTVDKENKVIIFKLVIDKKICSAMDYFEIFLIRMKMCKQAVAVLGYEFQLIINNSELI